MQFRFAAALAMTTALGAVAPASAADLPAIRVADGNGVPACATPGRLLGFLKSRNPKLDARFETIATEYMRHGEELGLRWDYAFFQMLLETGNLSFSGTVQPKQNNFAGMGATGRGEPGESFKDVSTGVRAHLEHVLMYSGQHVDNPVAERTRKVQEWGVLTGWQKTIKGPMTYEQLARQWAPKGRRYPSDMESIADAFYGGACKGDDPRPELIQEARAGRTTTPPAAKVADAGTAERESAAEIRRKAVEEARAEGAPRSGLGLTGLTKATEAPPAAAPAATEPAAKAETAKPKAQPAAVTAGSSRPFRALTPKSFRSSPAPSCP
jgi:hypothetical protein